MEATGKRALILAGGGLKVAFQAGVLQVWLDEAGLEFVHADGASGGVFNLAMWTQGMTGTEIADNWRAFRPARGRRFNLREYWKLPYASGLLRYDRFRKNVLADWGIDWDVIRRSQREATFNVYNFTQHRLEVVEPKDMTEDHLIAAVSLPIWFPPVRIGDDIYIDAVFNTDANLEEAVRRGASELWIVWTVSQRGEWHDGFVADYFQIIEAAANSSFRRQLDRIRASNENHRQGRPAEFPHPVEIRLLDEEVPLHYLMVLSKDRVHEAVNLGVESARRWCEAEGIPLSTAPAPPTIEPPTSLSFTEQMKGYVSTGELDFELAYRQGKDEDRFLMFELTIEVDDIGRFVTDPDHEASARGFVRSQMLGGDLAVSKGVFNLFTHGDDPSDRRMRYRLHLSDASGNPLTLSGFKVVKDDPGFDVWSDTSTLYTRILRGHLEADDEAGAEVVASGILRIHLPDFLKQLTTFRTSGGGPMARVSAMTRFGRLFLGDLWEVYAREVLTSSPL